MNIKQICGAVALAAIMSISAAQAADAPAASGAMAPAAATEKCDVTKDGKTTTVDVAVGTCVKNGGKLSASAATPAAPATPVAPAAGK
jgi:hypothetical protein